MNFKFPTYIIVLKDETRLKLKNLFIGLKNCDKDVI